MSRAEQETVSEAGTGSMGISDDRPVPLAVYYHTHWDREWYLPFRAYQLRLAEVVDDILDLLDRGVLSCFMLDGQTVVLDDYLALRPQNRERLQAYVLGGQISIGPWYVMPDEFLVGGESLIRNLVRGIRESRAWGCDQFTGYLPDTFGHSADMPTLLKHCGIDSAVVWRGIHPTQSLFRWQSPAGHSVKTLHLTDGYFQMMLQDWTATQTQQVEALKGLVQKLSKAQTQGESVLMPIGGDHLGALPEPAHQALKAIYPHLQETTPDQYLANLRANPDWETVEGELVDSSGSFLLPGVYSARMYLKQANRKLEHLLSGKLEPLLAMAQILLPQPPVQYPQHALALAWETLILNHPHDSICGCSVDAVHRENEVRFDQVAQLGAGLLHRTVQLFRQVLAGHNQWLVLNTGYRAYSGVVAAVEDVLSAEEPSFLAQQYTETSVLQDEYLHDSQRIPLSHLTKTRRQGWIWVDSVPSLGVAVLDRNAGLGGFKGQSVQVTDTSLENGKLTVAVSADGLLSVYHRVTGFRFENLLQFQDQPDVGDSYNSGPVVGDNIETAVYAGSSVVQAGPLVGTLALRHCFKASGLDLITHIRLDADSERLEFETTFTNNSPQHKLQAVFNTGQPVQSVMAETHLGVIERHYDPNYRERDFVPVEKMKELKTNTGPVQRFFATNGQGWLTEGLCEYEVYQNTIGITLLRAFGALSSADTGVRGAQAGPPFETPEGQCLNRTFQCRYAWLPAVSDVSALFEASSRFYGNVWAETGAASEKTTYNAASLLTVDNDQLVIATCYWLPRQGLVVRLVNPSHQSVSTTLSAGFEYRSIMEVNFLEEPQRELMGGSVRVEARDVKTILFAV
ncbi:alpha-mannosidase [Vampirovibrio sp.]|uniref:alpha-mannosidase n=1 Tax=Vampirovibrio sp. TaxID=2717857 RepID=UPI003593BCE3